MFGIDFSRNQKLAFFAVVGIAIVCISHAHLSGSRLAASDEVVIEEPGDGQARVTAEDSDAMPGVGDIRNSGKVICHVAGSVKRPGVYTLQSGQRVIDAIHAAGGAKPNADLEALNLAAKVEDGSKIEILSVQETRQAMAAQVVAAVKSAKSPGSRSSGSSSGKLSTPGEGLVRINSAGIEELQRLPGVGPATAEKIAAYRSVIGRFSRPEQLMDVKGIGPKTFERMRPFVAL